MLIGKIEQVPGEWKDDGHVTIKLPNETTWRIPFEVYNHIVLTQDRTDKHIKCIKTIAQTVADMAAMMCPFSGLTMMGLMMQASHAGKLIGEEIKPSEEAFNGTVNIVTTIRGPMEKEIKKLSEGLRKIGMESYLLHKKHDFKQCAKDIWQTMSDLKVLTDADRCRPVDTDELK